MAKSGVSLDFRKVTAMPASLVKGTVYFDQSDNLIKVATGTGSSDYQVFSGVRNVTWNGSTNELIFVNHDGSQVTVDFDNVATITELTNELNKVRAGIGFTDASNNYTGTQLADTSYIRDSSTVLEALRALDSQMHEVATAAGVVSVGGVSGAIGLTNGSTTNGDINLTMSGQNLQADIVGLGTAAFTNSSAYDVSGAAEAVRGNTTDSSDASTVYGAIAKAEAVKTELLGDSATDTSASKTIEGLIKRIDESNTDSELHLYSGASGTTTATTVTADGQTYRLVQGSGSTAATVATFNIEKDSFVTDGSVVKHDDASASAWGDAGTYIQLALRTTDTSTGSSEEKIIYIPATSLVDTYTANNSGHNVTVTVSGYQISAEVDTTAGTSQLSFNGQDVTLGSVAGLDIKAKLDSLESVAANTAGGVQLSEANNTLSARLIDNAVTTAKIVDGNVTTEKLDSSILEALNKANESVQSVTGETAVTNSSYIESSVEASTNSSNDVTLSSHANVTMHDVSTATASADGLATAFDVQQYVQQYVAEQLQWAEFAGVGSN